MSNCPEGRKEKLRRSDRLKFKEEQDLLRHITPINKITKEDWDCAAIKDVLPLIKRIMVTGRNLRKKILLGDNDPPNPNLRKTKNSNEGREEPKSMVDYTIQKKKKGRRKRIVNEKKVTDDTTSSKTSEVTENTLEIMEHIDSCSKSTEEVPVLELDNKNDKDISIEKNEDVLEVLENIENTESNGDIISNSISAENNLSLSCSKLQEEFDSIVIEQKNENIFTSGQPANQISNKVLPPFCLDREKYENVGLTQFASNPLIQTLLELKKNFPFIDHIRAKNGADKKKDLDVKLSNDVLGLDTITLGKDDCVATELSSSIQLSGKGSDVYFDPSTINSEKADSMMNKNADEIMKKSILPDDLERMEKAPKLFESKNSVKLKRKKQSEETAGKGWYNLPKTEVTDKIKKDLQIIKMRNVLDSKHHYKRNDTNKLPKYFQVGTIVEGAHEFYSSRVPKKQRKRTMVDELLDDAEFRRKNKKKYIEIRKKQMSGGKGYYKNLKNKKKDTWART